MLKWSPEPFSDDVVPVGGLVADPSRFASEAPASGDPDTAARAFRRESGFADSRALLASLTQEERSQVFELVEMDVSEEYAEREKELTERFATDLAAAKAEFGERFAAWTAELGAVVEAELRSASAAAADLALQLAGKIVRARVAVDREALVRCIETIIFKIDKDVPLTVHVSPDDAAWLVGNADLRDRLHVEAVVADRRLESGGAVVKADGREWDATLGAQLESLSEIVREMVSLGRASDQIAPEAGVPEDGHAPGLE